MNKHEWKSRAKKLERKNKQLTRRLWPDPERGESYANEVERQRLQLDALQGMADCYKTASAEYRVRALRAEAEVRRLTEADDPANPERVNNGCSIYRSPDESTP